MEIIGDQLLEHLPFTADPLLSWQEGTDLHSFLLDISDQEGTILLSDGRKEIVNYRDYGDYLFHQGKREYRNWAYHFTQSAEKSVVAYKGFADSVTLPDFYEDESFGTVAKYLVAWDGVVHTALSSGAFFSIAHILESLDDIECSCKLASELYYKHASQIIRSFLEDLVLPIYFAENPSAYSSWKQNKYRTPPLRGRKGILTELENDGVLSDELAGDVSELYGDLNSFIHGSEKRLVNRGHYSRSWVGHAFDIDAYLEWCNNVMKAITLGIHLLNINLSQWEALRIQHKVLCPICHNDKNFRIETLTFGGEKFTSYLCESCGDKMTHNFEGRQAYGQSNNGQLISYQY